MIWKRPIIICITIAPEDIKKTAVITSFGLFEFLLTVFGLCNSAQTFQRLIDEVLWGLPFVIKYIDDILIASSSKEEHEQHLRIVFERLREYGLTINWSKCVFGQKEITFLGHLVTPEGIKPLPEKIQTILDFPKPTVAHELRRFISICNFYRRFIPSAAIIQGVLQKRINGNKKKDTRKLFGLQKAFKCSKNVRKIWLMQFY